MDQELEPGALRHVSGLGFDVLLSGDPDDHYYKVIAHQLRTDLLLRVAARHAPNPAAPVLDIGANIGATTVLLAHLRPQATIHAFEPGAAAWPHLRRNVEMNGLGSVQLHRFALGANEGVTEFAVDAANSSANHLIGDTQVRESASTVQVRRLDDVCRDEGLAPSFVKIDVEGFEAAVFEGGGEVPTSNGPAVFVELNSFTTTAYGRGSPRDLIELLRARYARVAWQDLGHLRYLDSDSDLVQFLHMHYARNGGVDDLFCIPHEAVFDLLAMAEELASLYQDPASRRATPGQSAVDELAAIKASRSWRLLRRLQRLAIRLRGKPSF